MKMIFILIAFLTTYELSWALGGEGFPQKLLLQGQLRLQGTQPISMNFDLYIEKEELSKAYYKGFATGEGKYFTGLEINQNKNKTKGRVSLVSGYLSLDGPALDFESLHGSQLKVRKYEKGELVCKPKPNGGESCHQSPDTMVDTGVLELL